MKHWSIGRTENGNGEIGIILTNKDDDRVLSIRKEGENIVFTEECDGFFSIEMAKHDAIIALREAIDFIST